MTHTEFTPEEHQFTCLERKPQTPPAASKSQQPNAEASAAAAASAGASAGGDQTTDL